NPLAPAKSVDDRRLLIMPFRRDQDRDGTAYSLRRRIAEQALRARIPAPDDAIQGLGNDRVFGRFDDRGEVLGRAPYPGRNSRLRSGAITPCALDKRLVA